MAQNNHSLFKIIIAAQKDGFEVEMGKRREYQLRVTKFDQKINEIYMDSYVWTYAPSEEEYYFQIHRMIFLINKKIMEKQNGKL